MSIETVEAGRTVKSVRTNGASVMPLVVCASRHGKPANGAISCSKCCLQNVCLPCGLAGDELTDMDELTRVKRRVAKGSALYRAGDVFESLYALRSGSFKSVG